MHYLCKISGLEFTDSITTAAFPTGNSAPLATHPIFSVSNSTLLNQAKIISTQSDIPELTYYLLGLAVFNKLSPQWVTSADATKAVPIILNNFTRLVSLTFAIPQERRGQFPHFTINSQTNSFHDLPAWLDSIEAVFAEWRAGAAELRYERRVARIEAILTHQLARRARLKPAAIAKTLAEWAAVAGQFPNSPFYLPDGTQTTTSAYWKSLIIRSFTESHIELIQAKVDLDDFEDLVDYCETQIPHGSTHAAILMSKLRKARGVIEEFRPAKPKIPVLVPEIKTILVTNKAKIPEPKRTDFNSPAEYLRAKLKWQTTMIRGETIDHDGARTLASEL